MTREVDNFMRSSLWAVSMILLAATYAVLGQGTAQQKPENAELLRKARAAFYSLRAEGMTQFTCSIDPNWTALLKTSGVTDPKALDPAVAKLNQLRFIVTVDRNGSAKITHNEIPAENAQVSEGLKQIYSGMEQMTGGFFQTWSLFVIDQPLPLPGTAISLESNDREYLIKYVEDVASVAVNMNKDYSVTSVHTTTADFDSLISPRFTASGKGLLMNAYDAKYVGTGGKDKTELNVVLDYQDVSDLKLPKNLAIKGTYNGAPFAVEVVFSACTASKTPGK